MQTLKPRTIKAKSPLQTKIVFWSLFVASRGATNRIRIMSALKNVPRNKNQLSIELDLDYKAIQYHLKLLEKNNLVRKFGNYYGVVYCVSPLFENSEFVFDEIVNRLNKVSDKK